MALLQKRNLMLLTILAFDVVLSLLVLTIPHDRGNMHGTVPDEWAYYGWADMYMAGKFAVPIQDLASEGEGLCLVVPGAHPLSVEGVFYIADNDQRSNDLYVSVQFENGTPVSGAEVFIPQISLQTRTGADGMVEVYNLTIARAEVIARYSKGGENYLGSVVALQNGKGAMNYNVYISSHATVVAKVPFDTNTAHTIALHLPPDIKNAPTEGQFSVSVNGTHIVDLPLDQERAAIIPFAPPFTILVRGAGGNAFSGGIVEIDGMTLPLSQNGTGEFLGVGKAVLKWEVRDILDNPISKAEVYMDGQYMGRSGGNGTLAVTKTVIFGRHTVTFRKDGLGVENLFCVVSEVDGNYYLVSRWPPGHSILIGLLKSVGMEAYISLIMLVMASWAVFRLGEIYHSSFAGFIAALIWSSSGGTIMMVYSRYMADLATTSFAVFGFYLIVLALVKAGGLDTSGGGNAGGGEKGQWLRQVKAPPYVGTVFYGLLGGAFMAFSVVLRYSTAVVLIAPFVLGVIILIRSLWHIKGGLDKGAIRRLFLWAVPTSIGLLLVLLLLFQYNSTYFGGPFNSGYQMNTRINVAPTEEGVNATSDVPTETFFESYFKMDENDINAIPRKLSLMFYIHPAIILMFAALFVRKKALTLSFVLWSISIMVIYFSQSWAGGWTNETRSMEDMRYFLPAMPPAAIMVGALISEVWGWGRAKTTGSLGGLSPHSLSTPNSKKELSLRPWSLRNIMGALAIMAVIFLIIAGIIVGLYGIRSQVERMSGGGLAAPPTPQERPPLLGGGDDGNGGGYGGGVGDVSYINTTLHTVLANPVGFEGKGVHIQPLRIISAVRSDMFVVRQPPEQGQAFLHIEQNADVERPLKVNDTINVWAHVRRGFDNSQGLPNGSWELNVRAPPAQDRVRLLAVRGAGGVAPYADNGSLRRGDDGGAEITIIQPPTTTPLPRTTVDFAAVVSSPPPSNWHVRFIIGNEILAAKSALGSETYSVSYDLGGFKGDRLNVRAEIVVGDKVVAEDNITYGLVNGEADKMPSVPGEPKGNGGNMDDQTTALFASSKLLLPRILIGAAMVVVYAAGVYVAILSIRERTRRERLRKEQ